MNPFQIFLAVHEQELLKNKLRIPSACCLSTIGLDGYPNARFVAFKEMKEETFIVCGPPHSRKSIEMAHDPKVALTFWWTATEMQVRIQGDAIQIPAGDADKYFKERARKVQIISLVSMQGEPVGDMETLNKKLLEKEAALENEEIQRPENWGGYAINPLRIEFLEFNASRFHKRSLFQKKGGLWTMSLLQP
jgi:pyridoxamine 5'-phosphate oxidase